MGRPPVLPKKKKDGFWLEVRNRGEKSGIVLIRDSYEEMMRSARQYATTKEVIILGQHKDGKKVDTSGEKAERKKARAKAA